MERERRSCGSRPASSSTRTPDAAPRRADSDSAADEDAQLELTSASCSRQAASARHSASTAWQPTRRQHQKIHVQSYANRATSVRQLEGRKRTGRLRGGQRGGRVRVGVGVSIGGRRSRRLLLLLRICARQSRERG